MVYQMSHHNSQQRLILLLPALCCAVGNLDTVILQMYATLDDVSNAVRNGEVDMVFGLDTIDPQFFRSVNQWMHQSQEVCGSGCVVITY